MSWTDTKRSYFYIYTTCALIIYAIHLFGNGWVPLLDGANLLFHEAGHPLFSLLHSRLGVYGGTIGQLIFPILTCFHFYRQDKAFSFSMTALWFFENLLNIARYMGDARSQALPLVGGDHDWTEILSRWDLLQYDNQLSKSLILVSMLGSLALGYKFHIETILKRDVD